MKDVSPSFSSFFAGIGGFDLGFERNGFRSAFQCEINRFCTSVLEHHWPDVQRATDIQTLKPADIPESDVWCGGFPCQDVSVARGSKGREGLDGKNSGLFYPFLELIKARRPKVLVLENVVGLLSSHNGQDFRIVLEELTAIGYSVAWRIMNSRYFGAPQSRPRVFICASLDDPELPLRALYEEQAGAKPASRRAGFLEVHQCEYSGAKVPGVAYCLAATSGRHTGTDWSRTYISYHSSVRRLTPNECEGLQGFPIHWTDIPLLNGKNTADCDTPRYHALGNAVAVPVIEWIAKNIKTALKAEPRLFNGFSVSHATNPYSDFGEKGARIQELKELHFSTGAGSDRLRWQTGGYARKGVCIDIRAPEAPNKTIEKPLIEVIERHKPAKHYYLSANAAEGIIRRVDSQNRTLFGPMDAALRRLAKRPNRPSKKMETQPATALAN
jgi:DNA (cytosine-5)-methyltransferase 1